MTFSTANSMAYEIARLTAQAIRHLDKGDEAKSKGDRVQAFIEYDAARFAYEEAAEAARGGVTSRSFLRHAVRAGLLAEGVA